ncbi:MAG: DUF4145 domain-containing protein [Actinobacteria bacterium]|nr:DUF4145 domain-containing protein [Cyanobacteriota bacterium]MCL6087227.1 DUF4145 domain-containing protein [Actinomycetota bacterium]
MITNLEIIIEKKFEKLFTLADEIIQKVGWERESNTLHADPNPLDYNAWKVEAINLILKVSGKNSEHYNEFNKINNELKNDIPYRNFPKYYGVLKGLYNDFKEGLLTDIRNKIRAELVDDYLEQAKILFDDGYFCAAASLTGAVLEDTLRKLCDKNSLKYPVKTKIDILNMELAKNDIYDKLTQKMITAYADIRNNADHGNFKSVKKDDVEGMINGLFDLLIII